MLEWHSECMSKPAVGPKTSPVHAVLYLVFTVFASAHWILHKYVNTPSGL